MSSSSPLPAFQIRTLYYKSQKKNQPFLGNYYPYKSTVFCLSAKLLYEHLDIYPFKIFWGLPYKKETDETHLQMMRHIQQKRSEILLLKPFP